MVEPNVCACSALAATVPPDGRGGDAGRRPESRARSGMLLLVFSRPPRW